MPFQAATLLYMNSRRALVGDRLRNGWVPTTAHVLCLVLFGALGALKLEDVLRDLG